MIIGDNREKVIENIKQNTIKQDFHAKAEIGDPEISNSESLEIVNNFWKNQNKPSYRIANSVARNFFKNVSRVFNQYDEIDNPQNLRPIKRAFVTSNHFNQLDSLPVEHLAAKNHKNLYFVIEDTNLLLPSWIGYLMKHLPTIPLSRSISYLGRDFPKHLNDVLKKNNWILIYPEQEMWFNYRKPRPLQKGTYYYAAKLKVPIVSCFVEIRNTNKLEKNNPNFYKTKTILHVLPTIYPDPNLSIQKNAKRMCEKDYEQKKAAYEKAYGKKLDYTFSYDDIAGYRKK